MDQRTNGYVNKKFIVIAISGKRGYNQAVVLKEYDPSDYDWNPTTDQEVVVIGDLIIERPAPQPMTGWNAAPYTVIDDESKERRPGIEVFWQALMVDVRSVRIQIRESWGAKSLIFDSTVPYDPEDAEPSAVISFPALSPAKPYELRGKYLPFSGRITLWSNQTRMEQEGDWLSVTTPPVYFSGDDLAENSITLRRLISTSKMPLTIS